jgi:hypothetical protein
MSKLVFEDVLFDKRITVFVDTEEEYINAINNFQKVNKKEIIHSNERIIMPNYLNNLSKTLDVILAK